MKQVYLSIIASLAITSTSLSAHHVTTIKAADDYFTSSVCVAIAKNKPLKIAKYLKQNHISSYQAKKNITCNNQDLATFAHKHQAFKSIAYLQLDSKKATLNSEKQNKG